jgi:hypothetical protein
MRKPMFVDYRDATDVFAGWSIGPHAIQNRDNDMPVINAENLDGREPACVGWAELRIGPSFE